MKFDGEFSVAASPDEMWAFMLDPEEIGTCIPNCQNIEVIDEQNYTAEIGVSVSKISVTFDVDAEIVEQHEEKFLHFRLTGNAKEGDSRMESNVEESNSPSAHNPGQSLLRRVIRVCPDLGATLRECH